jgi:hypothetical protein
MEVGDLGEEDLDYPEDYHVHGVVDAAVGFPAVLVVTVGLVYSPVELFIILSQKSRKKECWFTVSFF